MNVAKEIKTRKSKEAGEGNVGLLPLARDFGISAFLFLLALIPRLLDLGRFLTPDEFLWVDRSRNFLAGLTNSSYQCLTDVATWEFAEGLACTLRTGHPGVTTMWTGSFGLVLSWLAAGPQQTLHDYVVGVSTNPLDPGLIAPVRFGTVVITSIWVVAVFWLLRRLVEGRIAWVAAFLLALNPFHIGLSRVLHHDALSTTFMSLSVLTAFVYWGQNSGRKWLLASGILAGFAFLSKSPALYLMPFIALTGVWFTTKDVWQGENASGRVPALVSRLFRRTLPDGLLWFAVSVGVVFAFWPAMWVAPLETISMVFFVGSKYATGGHAKGNFFLGEISKDPGALFYPVTWLFRTSPLVVLGVISALAGWAGSLLNRKNPPNRRPSAGRNSSFFRYLPLILLFIFGYYLLMTVGEKKQDRYFLPAYPWIDIIAAGGLVLLLEYFVALIKISTRNQAVRFVSLLVLPGIIILLNGYLVLAAYPYYFTYFNPLLGGAKNAQKYITVGWGEGLDLAADFLNAEISPMQTRVSSWYQSTFAPFYFGPSISYSKEKGKTLAGDAVIFYINQVQRRFPDDIMFDYFFNYAPPKKVITINGVDYVWIFSGPGIDHYVEDQTYTGIASLLAWQWAAGDVLLPPGENMQLDLFWEFLGKKPDEPFFFRLVDSQSRIWAEGQTRLVSGSRNPPVEAWRQGEILHEQGAIYLPPGIPPGQYQLQIGIYTNAPAVTEGELPFTLHPGDEFVTVGSRAFSSLHLPDGVTRINQPLGDSLNLLGAKLPQLPGTPGNSLSVELYWQIEQPLNAATTLHVGLMDESGEAKQAWFNLSLAETFNAGKTVWQPGDVIITRWQPDLLPDVPSGKYRLELVLPDDVEQTLSAGQVTVK